MRTRTCTAFWAWWIGLVLVGTTAGMAATAPAVSAAAPGDAPAVTRVAETGREVVLRGTLQRYAATGRDGREAVVLALRSQGRTYRLETAPSLRAPRTGSRVEVAGRLQGGVVTVTRLTRLSPPPSGWGRATAGRAPSHTKVLVLRVYSTRQAPAKPTTSQIRSAIIGDGNAWFEEVSHGRYSISGTATPWLKVKGGSNCGGNYFRTMDRAIAKAKQKGYSPTRFGRFVMYMPCSPGFMAGLGEMPGRKIWLFGYTDLATNVHEQGHNLGLRHANARACRSGGQAVTWSGSCAVLEYGDTSDVMGNTSAGHYNAYNKARLGWLQKSATVTGSTTRTLTAAERTGSGLKALRVRTGDRTYWVELRGGTGADADLPDGNRGVQIRLQKGAGTELLDAMPGTGGDQEWGDDWAHVTLPAGSSWTSPERVRITVRSQESSAAEVAVRFGAGRAKAPAAPSSVTASVGDGGTTVSWARPDDGGSIITKYTLTTSPGGVTKTVRSIGGLQTSARLSGLQVGTEHTVTVKAHNAVGASPGTASAPFTPVATDPSVTITSPADGATLTGLVTVAGTATPDPETEAPLSSVRLLVDGEDAGGAWGAPWEIEWDTTYVSNGPHDLELEVTDVDGQTGRSAPVSVVVDNPTATITVTSPTAGSTVTDPDLPVSFSTFPASWPWEWFEVTVDDEVVGWAFPGDALVADLSGLPNGAHALRVVGYAGSGETASSPVSFTLELPQGTVGFGASPAEGSTLTGEVQVDYDLGPPGWPWSWVGLEVESYGEMANTQAGQPLLWDTSGVVDGTYRIRLVGYDADWRVTLSSWRQVTVQN